MTPSSRALLRFGNHRVAALSLAWLLVLGLAALSAPLITALLGVDSTSQNILQRFSPPGSVVELSSGQKEQEIESWVAASPADAAALVALARARGWVSPTASDEDVPFELADVRAESPSTLADDDSPVARSFGALLEGFRSRHILGTDELGRDVLGRLLYGARVSLGVALLVGLCAGTLGMVVGCASGYFGGWLDASLMRVTDALLTIPTLPLYVIFAAIDVSKIPLLGAWIGGENQSVLKLVFILGGFTWMTIARIVRGAVLQVREREFVTAAESLGGRHSRIVLRHIIPNVLGPVTVAVTLLMGEAMLIESGLSFLGLGIQPPTPSWGNMLQNALELVRERPLLAVLPGLLVFSVIIAVNFVGDGLRDALDPRSGSGS